MAIVRWEPYRELETFFNRMMPGSFARAPRTTEAGDLSATWAPAADISETDTEFLIRAELPAVKREDVKITIESGVITIAGSRKQESEQKDEKFHRIESFQVSFSRSFSLPENIDEAAIRAESKDGVLMVHLPKVKVEKRKPVEIRVQ
jgi:HSP20 family protein